MATQGSVAIFWDFDSCTPTYNSAGYNIVDNIRKIAMIFGHITSFKAYLEIEYAHPSFAARSLELRTELQASGVSLTDCPANSSCNILNQMLAVDLVLYATDHAGPNTTIVLISGNRGFAYALASLRLRNHQVVLICPSNTHPSLLSQVTARYDWNSEVLGKPLPASGGPPLERPPSTRPSMRSRSRSRAYSMATTTGYAPSGSKPAYTANETALHSGDESESDFYMDDPTLFNTTGTPYTNAGRQRSESPLPPWSERPPLNSLRSRSDSRAYSPAMSFRSAKTSILTSPPTGPAELPSQAQADVGVQTRSATLVNGDVHRGQEGREDANGPADPIEPLFATSPESIVPKKPAVNGTNGNGLVGASLSTRLTSITLSSNPLPTPAPQLATPNASNEPALKGAEAKTAFVEAIAANAPPLTTSSIVIGQESGGSPPKATVPPVPGPVSTVNGIAPAPTSSIEPQVVGIPSLATPALVKAVPTAASAPAPAKSGPTATSASTKPAAASTSAPTEAKPAAPSTAAPAKPATTSTPVTTPAGPATPAKPATPSKSSTLNSSATTFSPSSSPAPQPAKAKSAPAHWRVLIDVLETRRRTMGQANIPRSDLGTALAKHKPKDVLYAAAGTTNFANWIKKAEEAGIVLTGGSGNNAWVALRPEWVSSTVLV